MTPFQLQLEAFLGGFTGVAAFMQTTWAWPLVESAHFIGLTLLLGAIAAWDLRLVGVVRNVPAAAFHRLIPFAVAGFGINASTGALFLVTYPDQYVYNPAFQFKVLCLFLAGVNVLVFYALAFRALPAEPDAPLPRIARVSGAVSLAMWTLVIISGRMITFFRPTPCPPDEVVNVIAQCIVR